MKQSLRSRPSALRLLFILFMSFTMVGALAQGPSFTLHKGLPGDTTRQIVYGNGIYLAVLVNPVRFFASADGASWMAVTVPDVGRSYHLRPVLAYGAGLFVCVADSGKIFTSPDGAAWTLRNSGKGADFKDVGFFQSAFYAVGDSATLLHSTNGIDWDALQTGIGAATDSYDSVRYGNGYTLIIATNANEGKVLYRSGAGTLSSWTANTITGLESIEFLKDHFYLFGDNDVLRSTDAATWTSIVQPGIFEYLPISGFDDGARVYLTGNTYYGSYGDGYGTIYRSDDGLSFDTTIRMWNRITGGIYANHLYFAYGVDGIESTPTGVSYQTLGATFNALASDGQGYVGVGTFNNTGQVFTSSDFNTWTERLQTELIRLYSVIYDGTRYVDAGNDETNSFVYASPDGGTWDFIGPQEVRGVGVPFISTVAYGAGTYLATGAQASTTYSLSESSDGVYWGYVQQDLSRYSNMRAKFLNGYFFVMADSNTYSTPALAPAILVSQGNNWVNITPNLPFTVKSYNDVVYDGSKYTVIGMEGDLNTGTATGFFSVSTADINNPGSYGAKGVLNAPPAGAVLNASSFAYSNGHFVGGATDLNAPGTGYLLYSTDGLHWDNTPLGAIGSNFIGNIPNGDVFRLLSHSNVALTVSFPGVPLPVTLLNFTAVAAGHSSLLTWQTVQEENSSRFLVQRSLDGVRWDSIGVVAAAGQSQVVTDYRFTDASPQIGDDYYRLLLLDLDGRSQFSPVRSVYFGEGRPFGVYPNPAVGSTTVMLPETAAGVAVLYNGTGAEVLRQEFNGYAITLSLQGLPAGVYHLTVRQNGKQYTREILHP